VIDEVVRAIKRVPGEIAMMVAGAQNAVAGLTRVFQLGGWEAVGQTILTALNGALAAVWEWVQAQAGTLAAQFEPWIAAFGAWVGPAAEQFLKDWPQILRGVLDEIGKAIGPIAAQLGEWAIQFSLWVYKNLPNIIAALGAIAIAVLIFIGETAVVLIEKLFEWGKAFIEWVAPRIPELLAEFGKMLVAIVGWLTGTALPKLVTEAYNLGVGIVKAIYNGIRSLSLPMPKIDFALDSPFSDFPEFKVPRVTLGVSWTNLADLIPALAEGGIVSRPTLALIGERGPEAVVPLGKMGNGGGQTVINLTVNGSVLTEGDLVDAVYAGLLRRQNRTGSLGFA
jgi:hypothetical protein